MKPTIFHTLLSLLTIRNDDPPPPSHLPCSQEICDTILPLQPLFFPSLNPSRQKSTYGPLLSTPKTFYFNSPSPCTDCFLTNIHLNSNPPNSIQHVLISNLEKDSQTCNLQPEPIITTTSSPLSLNGRSKTGYYISNSSTTPLVFSGEINSPDGKEVFLEVDWEYIPGSSAEAEGFKSLTPIWLDLDGVCSLRNSRVPPVSVSGQITSITMDPAWKSDISGEVVLFGGELSNNNGGILLDLTRNGQVICEITTGQEEEGCVNIGRMEVGDEWGLIANYNSTEATTDVMGIGLIYVVRD